MIEIHPLCIILLFLPMHVSLHKNELPRSFYKNSILFFWAPTFHRISNKSLLKDFILI